MFFNKKVNEETARILLNENKRLKRDNELLRKQVSSMDKVKNEYEKLIRDVKDIKERYKNKLSEFEKIENDYNKELKEILNNIRKQG